MGKSRKHKGGNPTSVDCTKQLCPTLAADGGSLAAITKKGIYNQKAQADNMTKANKALVGGGKRKKVLICVKGWGQASNKVQMLLGIRQTV